MRNKTYSFDESTKTLTVFSDKGVKDFCKDNNINLGVFNYPTVIDNSVSSCCGMFEWCKSFNQPITIPKSVTNCSEMFCGCVSFNQPTTVPDSFTDCSGMFGFCTSLHNKVTIPNSAVNCEKMFYECPHMNEDGTPKLTADNKYVKFMLTQRVGTNYLVWFKENFPNGASSLAEVANKLTKV